MCYAEMICLAYSRKMGGCCVAGIEITTGRWIRPVSGTQGVPLSADTCRLQDRSQPAVLDLIKLKLGCECPSAHQIENVRALRSPWQLVSRPAPVSIKPLLLSKLNQDQGIFGDKAVYLRNTVAIEMAKQGSATLVKPHNVRFFWQSKFRTQLRTSFYHLDDKYNLPITDVAVELRLNGLERGRWINLCDSGLDPGLDVFFTITLGEPFHTPGFAEPLCYKLVSGIVIIPQCWDQAV